MAPRYAEEDEMPAHMITFGPVGFAESGQSVHILGDKPADVVDMVCPCCGDKLFLYYRTLPSDAEVARAEKELAEAADLADEDED